MTTTTKVDGFRIYEDGDVHESTHYTSDDDLTVNIRKGWDMGRQLGTDVLPVLSRKGSVALTDRTVALRVAR